MHDLFSEQAKRTPRALAVQAGNRRLTFEELDFAVSRLASELRALSVGPETPVGLCSDVSLDSTIAMLAILKAGGAFVPLDPQYPIQRLEFMTSDTGLEMILAAREVANRLTSLSARIIPWQEGESLGRSLSEELSTEVTLDNTASILYTSGSVGQPKAVMRLHRALACRQAWAPSSPDVYCHHMSWSVGVSQKTIFLPLVSGYPLVIIPTEESDDPLKFIEALAAGRVTNLTISASQLQQVLAVCESSSLLPELRTIFLGGLVTADLARQLRRTFPNVALGTFYGSTETGPVSFGPVDDPEGPAPIPVGGPVANVRFFILDGYLRPVREGESGELYVAAPSLARGYWNKPGLTAERFITNPFEGHLGERFYRTGDFARCISGGIIAITGRADRQVKVRGFRVELDEVEQLLASLESLTEAAVTLEQIDGENHLIAFVVPKPGVLVTTSELRNCLLTRLPKYMIPSTFVRLDGLPRTSLGKLDRASLSSCHSISLDDRSPNENATNKVESALIGIWEDVLHKSPIGIHDDFMDLGGESLAATKIASRIAEKFDVRVPVPTLFTHPSVAELAVWLSSNSPSRGTGDHEEKR